MLTRTTTIVALAASGAIASAAGAAAQTAPTSPELPGPPALEKTWTARILYPVAARRTPGGAVVARLQHYTNWSQGPSAYMVTTSTVVKGRTWIRVQLPKRPNGTQGWIPQDAVELRQTTTWIRVSTRAKTLTVFVNGKRAKRFRVGVGTGGTPTPRGRFAILDPVPVGGYHLGPYIMVLTAHSTVHRTFMGGDGIVGIHGWPTSTVLGKAVSNGCVRMSRGDVRALARYARPGVPVEILA
jgi:lipoprotein-anchoring transpeptidase ErfK/SrfK